VATGVMPSGSVPPASSSSARWLQVAALLFLLLWGELAHGGGRADASPNKLGEFPDPAEDPFLVLVSGGHRGGGSREKATKSSSLRRLERCISTSAMEQGLRRPPKPMGSG
jgi:hypothetical protein